MGQMDQFKTREKASDGVKIPLSGPDGSRTDHWLMVLSAWSDEYQDARNRMIRDAATEAKALEDTPKPERDSLQSELDRKRRVKAGAALISGWSFDDVDCNEEEKIAFLLEAPQILSLVERIAENDKRFFGKGWTSLSNGESQK